MPYPQTFARMQVSGSLFTAESFSWSLSIAAPGGFEDWGVDVVPPAIVTAVRGFHEATSGPPARLQIIKLNELDIQGHYLGDQTVFHDYGTTGVPGQTGNPVHPPQIALVVSLTTERSRGLAHAGRFYIPCPAAPLQQDGRITDSAATFIAQQASSMLNSINAALPGDYQVVVASDVREGAIQPVTGVRVGRVLDTVRSRRTSLAEEYMEGQPISA